MVRHEEPNFLYSHSHRGSGNITSFARRIPARGQAALILANSRQPSPHDARAGDLPRNFSDADRPSHLIGGLQSHDDIAEIRQRARDDEDGLPHTQAQRFDGTVAFELPLGLRRVATDADHANAELVAEAVGDLAPGRRYLELQEDTATVDLEPELMVGAGADDALHVGKGLDRLP